MHLYTQEELSEMILSQSISTLKTTIKTLKLTRWNLYCAIHYNHESYLHYSNAVKICRELYPNQKWEFVSYSTIESFFWDIEGRNQTEKTLLEGFFKTSPTNLPFEVYKTYISLYEKYLEEDDSICEE